MRTEKNFIILGRMVFRGRKGGGTACFYTEESMGVVLTSQKEMPLSDWQDYPGKIRLSPVRACQAPFMAKEV
jgi:hypothetical protein